MEHVIFRQSASSGARSVACPGWSGLVWYYRHVIKERPSEWSADGDAAHLLIENAINKKAGRKTPKKKAIAQAIERLRQTDDKERHFAAIQFATKILQKQIKKFGGKWETEKYVVIFDREEFGGHVDFQQVTKNTVHIIDYKHGVGVEVIAQDNLQTIAYAYGIYQQLPDDIRKGIKHIVVTVIQPRCMSVKPIQQVTYTVDQMMALIKHLQAGVGNANGVLIQCQTHNEKPRKLHLLRGDHCQFCPGKTHCPQWSDKAKKVVKTYKKATKDNPDAYPDLTQKKLEQLLLDAKGIAGYLRKVEEFVQSQIATKKGAGLLKTIPGNSRTVVNGNATELLKKALKKKKITQEQFDSCYKQGFTTLGELQTVLPPKLYTKLVKQTRNKPQLVAADDKRKSLAEHYKGKFNG